MITASFVRASTLVAAACFSASAWAQITIPTVTIGNPGNARDWYTGAGAVNYVYNIGTTEVTNAQYVAFLNAKAATDTYGLYDTNMASFFGGIVRSGAPGSYTYATVPGRENNPVTWVSFFDACRFANWLHNGQGSGDTETGAYLLDGVNPDDAASIGRYPGWRWAVTEYDEWYKAAYHQPAAQGGDTDDYWLYPTSSNTEPTAAQANILFVVQNTKPVGSYAANFYGTFDMCGNVAEWTTFRPGGTDRASRGISGGSFYSSGAGLWSRSESFWRASDGWQAIGFRVVQSIPPCAADFDGSGFVDSDDFIFFATQFEPGCTGPDEGANGADWSCLKSADFDASGFVDSDDFVAFIAAFESEC
ncbi:MAG: SUMF1/EgtB/PvdO family nonheme iron enzyme [Planctomycetota bacterium]|nr:SUMF1/EgtB/PvdO family nonheme iron enzyme [Planctomycetota bacterium]